MHKQFFLKKRSLPSFYLLFTEDGVWISWQSTPLRQQIFLRRQNLCCAPSAPLNSPPEGGSPGAPRHAPPGRGRLRLPCPPVTRLRRSTARPRPLRGSCAPPTSWLPPACCQSDGNRPGIGVYSNAALVRSTPELHYSSSFGSGLGFQTTRRGTELRGDFS